MKELSPAIPWRDANNIPINSQRSQKIAGSDLKFHPSHIVDMTREFWIQGKFKEQKSGALLT